VTSAHSTTATGTSELFVTILEDAPIEGKKRQKLSLIIKNICHFSKLLGQHQVQMSKREANVRVT
jgi:hypothetical protein